MGVRISWEMAVMSSELASQARRSFPIRSITDLRMLSISPASMASSSSPCTVIGASRSPEPMSSASLERRMIRLVRRRMYQNIMVKKATLPRTTAITRLMLSSRTLLLSPMAMRYVPSAKRMG